MAARKRKTRKNSNPYIMLVLLEYLGENIENATLPMTLTKPEKAEFMKDVFKDTMLDLIDMINKAPYGAIPIIRNFYPIQKGNDR